MDLNRLKRRAGFEWEVRVSDRMRVPAVIFASEKLLRGMDDKVLEQTVNVASLPGIQKASFAMPDAYLGYGFPIGGVAAFDADEGGVVSAGGVGIRIEGTPRLVVLAVDQFLKGAGWTHISEPKKIDPVASLQASYSSATASVDGSGVFIHAQKLLAALITFNLSARLVSLGRWSGSCCSRLK
jgi:RNA-splicing ligase RtcB